jgi:twitching motility two-component system response regulator PilG
MTYTTLQPPTTEQPKISPAKALSKLVSEERSGRLTLTDPNDPSIQWRVYFGGGQIHFAGSLAGWEERLSYVLAKDCPRGTLNFQTAATSDYDLICQHWQQNQWPLNWIRKIFAMLTQEALVQFLAVPAGHIQYEPSIGLDPLLLSVPLRELVLPVRDAVGQWTQLRNELASPFQRPVIHDPEVCLQLIQHNERLGHALQDLMGLIDQQVTLYEMANRLSMNLMELATVLQPMIQAGGISVAPFETIKVEKRPVVVCVDDSPTIQQFVKLALEGNGYDVLSLMDPSEAIAHMLVHEPTLILMDIEMPKMDGYELCKMVRNVDSFRKVPVVMLTGREGLIDRMRARMSGCTAYLTKPFNPQELLALVQKLSVNPVSEF